MNDPNTPTVIGTGSPLGSSLSLSSYRTLNVTANQLVSGTFTLAGGTNTVGQLTVDSLTGQGNYTLNTGTLSTLNTSSGVEIIGGFSRWNALADRRYEFRRRVRVRCLSRGIGNL